MNPDFDMAFVLDDAPEELIHLVSYLKTPFDRLLIGLITISSYIVNVSQILVPQLVVAEPRREAAEETQLARPMGEGQRMEEEEFAAALVMASAFIRTLLRTLCDWAVALEQARLAKLYTYHGKAGILTLLPRLQSDNAGLVSIYNNNGSAYLQFWRSVFERRASNVLARIEASIPPIKRGNIIRDASDALLEALTEAYREAAGRPLTIE